MRPSPIEAASLRRGRENRRSGSLSKAVKALVDVWFILATLPRLPFLTRYVPFIKHAFCFVGGGRSLGHTKAEPGLAQKVSAVEAVWYRFLAVELGGWRTVYVGIPCLPCQLPAEKLILRCLFHVYSMSFL